MKKRIVNNGFTSVYRELSRVQYYFPLNIKIFIFLFFGKPINIFIFFLIKDKKKVELKKLNSLLVSC